MKHESQMDERVSQRVVLTAFIVFGIAFCTHGCGRNTEASPSSSVPSGDDEQSSELRVRWFDPVLVASGEGTRGPWRMNESRFYYVDDATVATSDEGMVAVAWVDNRQQDVFFRSYDFDGKGRSHAINVSRNPEVFSWLPAMVMSPDGQNIGVLWQEIIFSGGSHGGEILFSHSADRGQTFSTPINLSNTTAGAGKGRLTEERWDNGSLDLARGQGGELYAAWTEYEGALRFSRSLDDGQSFEPPSQLSGSQTQPARAPALATGDGGAVYLAWTVGQDKEADILFTYSENRGTTFAPAQIVHDTGGYSDAPDLVHDRAGTLHLTYAESPGGMFTASHVRYTKRSGNAFEPAERLSGSRQGDDSAAFPTLALGKANHVYVMWEQYPDLGQRAFGLGLVVSTNGGESFSNPATVPHTEDRSLGANAGLQGSLMDKLDVSATGNITIVHNTFLPGESSRIQLLRGKQRER